MTPKTLFFLVVMLYNGVAAADWVELNATTDGNAYIDKENVVTTGATSRFQWLIDSVVDSETSKSVIVTSELNCNKRLMRHQQVVEYSEHMAKGEIVATHDMTNQWIFVQRGSLLSSFIAKFCYTIKKD